MIAMLLRLLDIFNKSTSNNLHNYIVASFLAMSILSSMSALGMTIWSWWKGGLPPPKEIFTLLEMELYALGTYAAVNATAHVTKTIKGKSGANSEPLVVEPKPE